MLFLENEESFWSSGWVWLYFEGFNLWSKPLLASNSRGLGKKLNFSPKGTGDCQNSTYESLIIVDTKYVEISTLA